MTLFEDILQQINARRDELLFAPMSLFLMIMVPGQEMKIEVLK